MSVFPPGSEKQAVSAMAISASCVALVISFIGLSQFDLPIVRYVRSVTIHLPWDQLTIPWMAFTSHAGNWIGEGWHLTALSLVLLAVGWVFKKPTILTAAVQSLIGHAIVAVAVNGLKHVIGRPRPKFTHSGDWHMSVSWASGWDSFPSGHTAASFAVATVLAKRFPMFGPLCLAVAAYVALSRVLRGSHFPTDVVGGAVLGCLSGAIASAPLKEWRASIQDGGRHAAIGASAILSLLWTLARPMDDGVVGGLLLVLAVGAVSGGLWLRRAYWLNAERSMTQWHAKASTLLIAYGLAAMTTSPLVLSAVGFACLAVWFAPIDPTDECSQRTPGWFIGRESALLGGWIVALVVLVTARAVLPFR